jgi:hypothetical protein
MSERASKFLSTLHRSSLKGLGFKKVRQTFSRQVGDDYIEYFNFQGSQWNSSDRPWGFYLNIGVYFLLPSDDYAVASFTNSKLHGRPGHLIKDAPSYFELSEAAEDELLTIIPGVIQKVSDRLKPILPLARERAMKGEYTFIGEFGPNANLTDGSRADVSASGGDAPLT